MYNYGVDHSFIIYTCVLLGDFLKHDVPKHGLKIVKLIRLLLQREYFHRTISLISSGANFVPWMIVIG